MKILTWNVNGIRTLLQYHPWNVHKTYEAILDELGADITCVQETKITRAQTDTLLACMPTYDSFFSYYRRTPPKGIHGTAIFTKRETVVPVKAEEGIGASLVSATEDPSQRIGGYPLSSEVDLSVGDMKDLDLEGRTTVCDVGMFVIINLYCPNETNEDRLVFKNSFNLLVDRRVRSLIKAGREVIVVGDLNICASPMDSAGSEARRKEQGLESYVDHPPRRWLSEFVGPDGPMIDITRKLHPTRKDMYTCWDTKIDARPSNYGTRLDYVLITPGLLPWVRDANILPSVMGSDHCPVFIEFYDQIGVPGRGTVHIWDELNAGRTRSDVPPPPPAFAARHFDEFSGRQKKLSSFFTKKSEGIEAILLPSASAPALAAKPTPPVASGSKLQSGSQPVSSANTSLKGKGNALVPGEQQSISSFFKPPPPPPKAVKKKNKAARQPASAPQASTSNLSQPTPAKRPTITDTIIIDDEDPPESFDERDFEVAASTVSAWSNLFATKALPLCEGHNEPSKLWTVNKSGINKGRRFYMCSRPVGPGYDKGQAKLHVNKEWRCNYFEWETKVTRPPSLAPAAKKQKT